MRLRRNEPASENFRVIGPSSSNDVSMTLMSAMPWKPSVRGSRVSTSTTPPILRPYRDEKLPG